MNKNVKNVFMISWFELILLVKEPKSGPQFIFTTGACMQERERDREKAKRYTFLLP